MLVLTDQLSHNSMSLAFYWSSICKLIQIIAQKVQTLPMENHMYLYFNIRVFNRWQISFGFKISGIFLLFTGRGTPLHFFF